MMNKINISTSSCESEKIITIIQTLQPTILLSLYAITEFVRPIVLLIMGESNLRKKIATSTAITIGKRIWKNVYSSDGNSIVIILQIDKKLRTRVYIKISLTSKTSLNCMKKAEYSNVLAS